MTNQRKNQQGITNYVDVKQDGKQMKFGKQPFNTRMGEVINDFIHISLVKYALQSLKGQKKEEEKERRRGSKEAQFLPTSSSRFRPLL